MDIFLSRLKKLGKTIQKDYPYINHGGCAIYAIAVAKELKKLRIHPKILVVSPERGDVNTDIRDVASIIKTKSNICEWNNQGVIFRHVIISFCFEGKQYHYDTDGLSKASEKYFDTGVKERYTLYKGHLSMLYAKEIVKRQSGWNSTFDRNDIPAINQIVKDYMEPKRWATREWLAAREIDITM